MHVFDLIDRFAASGVVAITIVAAVWAFRKWRHRPQLICGVPPTRAEQQDPEIAARLGRLSVANGFRHRVDCLAEPFRDRVTLPIELREQYYANPLRRRRVQVAPDGTVSVNVLLANNGARMAREYSASIVFLPDGDEPIALLGADTESLSVTSLYASAPDRVDQSVKDAATESSIVDAYDDYLGHLCPSWGDALYLGGSLEAGMYELVHLRAAVTPNTSRFLILFTVDCADGWLGASRHIQACVLDRAG